MSVNVVALTGRLTKDVELRQTTSGTSVCNFTIAVDSGYGDEKKTDFINIKKECLIQHSFYLTAKYGK